MQNQYHWANFIQPATLYKEPNEVISPLKVVPDFFPPLYAEMTWSGFVILRSLNIKSK